MLTLIAECSELMGFSDFHGNADVIHRLRDMLARNRFPHAVILAGPAGSGKYTLSLMLAKAMNCLSPILTDDLPDFCSKCSNCVRIAQAEDLDTRWSEAEPPRDFLRKPDKKKPPLFAQPHPDVLFTPPDPPQLMIKVDQVRRVIESIYFRPGEAKERVYIFTDSAFMKEAANSLLKVLEEPPEFATIFLLAENPGELLATIRSRSMTFCLGALSAEEIERYLTRHRPDWDTKQRSLVARLCEGAVGRARGFDLTAYIAARDHALTILASSLRGSDHSQLFKVTETYRSGAEGREKIEALLRTLYSLLQDIMFLNSGTPRLVRNTDVQDELKKLSESADFAWVAFEADRLSEVERGIRRTLLRSLSLDAFATALERR